MQKKKEKKIVSRGCNKSHRPPPTHTHILYRQNFALYIIIILLKGRIFTSSSVNIILFQLKFIQINAMINKIYITPPPHPPTPI